MRYVSEFRRISSRNVNLNIAEDRGESQRLIVKSTSGCGFPSLRPEPQIDRRYGTVPGELS